MGDGDKGDGRRRDLMGEEEDRGEGEEDKQGEERKCECERVMYRLEDRRTLIYYGLG